MSVTNVQTSPTGGLLDFDKMAEHFDKILPHLMPLSEQLFAHLPALPAGTRVLDLACGTGEPAFSLSRRYPATSVLGIDGAERMIQIARGKLARDSLTNIRFEVMPMEHLSLEAGSHDAVISRLGFLMVEDWAASGPEMARVLKPGGCYSFAVWDEPRLNTVAHTVSLVLRSRVPADLLRLFDRLEEGAAEGQRERFLQGLGLASVNTKMFHWNYHFTDFATLWNLVGTFAQLFAQLNQEQRVSAREEMEKLLSAYCGPDGSYTIPQGCRLFWGTR